MDAQLQVWLSGDFRAVFNHRPILDSDSPRLQSFFAYLVIHSETPVSKQQLASLFWPDTEESQARTNLRRLIFRLRQGWNGFDRYLTSTEAVLVWKPNLSIWCDFIEFKQAIEKAKRARTRGERYHFLEKAVALYKGDLFPGCYEDWIIPQRDEFRQQYVEISENLIQIADAKGDFYAGIHFAEQLRVYDILYEPVYLYLMRFYLKNGNRAKALEVFQQCCQVFQDELNITPGYEIQSIYRNLLHLESLAAPHLEQKEALPFIGRESEWIQLHESWNRADNGPYVVMIKGETGIGKSRLAEEFARWVQTQNFETGTTRCYASEGSIAYMPVANWLLDPYQKQKANLDPASLRELARILPGIMSDFPRIEPPLPMTESWQRLQFFEALTKTLLFSRLRKQMRLLLVIDDLQWCDAETLEWLHYLLRFDSERSLLVLATYRIEEIVDHGALEQFIQTLRSEGKLEEIDLAGLSQKNSAELAAQILNQSLDEEAAARLFLNTSGNPLYVVEVARTWEFHQPEISARLHGLIAARLAQLSALEAEVLDVTATIGREFSWDLIAIVTGIAEEHLQTILGNLFVKRILHEQRANTFDFIHDQIREVAYTRIPPLRRRSLHRRVAEAIQKTCGEAETGSERLLDFNAAQIAAHYEKAGSLYLAFQFFARAAEYAAKIYAHQEADTLYASAIQFARQLNWPGPQLARLYAARGRSLEHLGLFPEAVQVYKDLEALARERNDPEMQCVALSREAACYNEPSGVHNPAAGRPLLAKGLAIARAIGAYDLEAQMQWALLVDASHYGRLEDGREAAESCLKVARDHVLKDCLAVCLHDYALNLRLSGDPAYGAACAEESRATFRAEGNLSMLVDSLNQQAWIDCLQLQFQSAREYVLEADQISRSIQNNWNLAYANWIQAMLHEAQGKWSLAMAFCEESLAIGQDVGFLMSFTSVKLLYGDLLRRMGQLDQAMQLHQEALEASQKQASFLLFASQAQIALDYFAVGDLDTGGRFLVVAQNSGLVGVIGPCIGLPYLSRALAEWATRSRDWEAALSALRPVLADAQRRALPFNLIQVQFDYGCCLEGAGRVDEAEFIFLKIQSVLEKSQFHRMLHEVDLALAAHFYHLGRFEQQKVFLTAGEREKSFLF